MNWRRPSPPPLLLPREQGLRFRSSRFALRCVRPFRIIDVSLANDSGIDTDAPDVELQVQDFLMGQARRERGWWAA